MKYNHNQYQLDEKIELRIQEEELKARKHPGVMKIPIVELPKWIRRAMDDLIDGMDKILLWQFSVKIKKIYGFG